MNTKTDELERMRIEVMNAEGMAECMAMFRDDMIRAGVITEETPPMFMTEAILSALHKAGWRHNDQAQTARAGTEQRNNYGADARARLERIVMPNSMWSSDLQCDWISWRVVDTRHLALDLPNGDCCDMSGAIKLAQALCPLVQRIDTFSGGAPDTRYVLTPGSTDWIALVVSA